ncbi:MAG: antibiotic biosynthesis monooxygenase [Beijerinckiaceae bacterium]|jgi:quinol monooxygenase YgiN|nr:antibiotic biosynthesis monooxygenase [Beijerinckiaceae bacterium]MDO9440559.1 antibiotic biosynthesis monooxygenase family protein [Beijerinckiaceae bacterium]
MPQISETSGYCTQITTVELDPKDCAEVLDLMNERAAFMATQPGFVSVSLHRSTDGSKIVNYVQWANAELLSKAHHHPEFRDKWPRIGELTRSAEPALYDVVHIRAKG